MKNRIYMKEEIIKIEYTSQSFEVVQIFFEKIH